MGGAGPRGVSVGLLSGRVKRRGLVGGWIGVVGVASALGWGSVSNGVVAHAATPRGIAVPVARALRCVRILCNVGNPYVVDYSGTETLLTLSAPAGQPFSQAGRKLYIKLKWDLKLFRNKKTNAVEKESVKVSGVVDLTLPDNPTLDCTGQYTLTATNKSTAIENTYINIVTGPKALVQTHGIPAAGAPCNDSGLHPFFSSQAFQTKFNQAFQPVFTVPCSAISKAGGVWSKPFNFGPRTNPAGLSTVGLGPMEATIRSKVVISDVTCVTGVFG